MRRRKRRKTEAPQASRWTWTIPLGVLVLLAALYFTWPGFRGFVDEGVRVVGTGDRAQVEPWVQGYGSWGFAVILALMLLQTLLAFLPSLVTVVVAVLAYGPFAGGALAWGGLLMAACLGYGIGRSLGPVTVDRLVGAKTEQKVRRFVERYGAWAVVLARLTPLFSSDAVSFAAGLAKMGFGRFVLATAAGTLPLVAVVAFVGSDPGRLKTGLVVISAAGVVAFLGYLLYQSRRRR